MGADDLPGVIDRERLVAEMAAQVRQAYVLQYQRAHLQRTGKESTWGDRPIARWDGGEGKDGRWSRPVWPRVAEFCLERQVDPIALVAALFRDHDPRRDHAPYPNQLTSARALEKLAEQSQSQVADLRRELKVQRMHLVYDVDFRVATRGGTDAEAARDSLASLTSQYSALFRHCCAAAAGEDDLAARFLPQALRAYAFSRGAYDHAWGEFIPEALRAQARDYFGRITGPQGNAP